MRKLQSVFLLFQYLVLVFGKLLHIHLSKGTERNLFFLDVSHGHNIIAVQAHGTIVISVQILADYAGAELITELITQA